MTLCNSTCPIKLGDLTRFRPLGYMEDLGFYHKATNNKMLNLTRLNCNHTVTGAKLSLELLPPMLAGYRGSFIAGRNPRDGIRDHRPDIVGQEGPEVAFTENSLESYRATQRYGWCVPC